MGIIRYKYRFDQPPSIEDIADRFRALTGLAMTACRVGDGWELSATPLRGHVELSYDGNTLWAIPWHERWLGGSYFLAAFNRTLRELGAQRQQQQRLPGYATRRWGDLPSWLRWLHR